MLDAAFQGLLFTTDLRKLPIDRLNRWMLRGESLERLLSLLFKSNARVPHEVLAANADRYAVTLWYFHKEEVTAARTTPVTEEEKRAQEEKIRREIETMRRKFGGGGGGDGGGDGDDGDAVKVRPSRTAAWTRALPSVPPPCAVRWDDDGTTLAFTVPLPRGTAAGARVPCLRSAG